MSWRLATSDTLSYLVYQAPGAVTRLQRRPAACRFTALLSARFNHSEYPPRSHSLKPVPSIASSCNQRGRHNRLSRQARHLHPGLYKRRAAASCRCATRTRIARWSLSVSAHAAVARTAAAPRANVPRVDRPADERRRVESMWTEITRRRTCACADPVIASPSHDRDQMPLIPLREALHGLEPRYVS
jgi:hypothetical protein